ncbi:MAG: hypothetical protein WCE21_03440 [Candidatus Babeliales bacterium]
MKNKTLVDGLVAQFVHHKIWDTHKATSIKQLFHDRSQNSFITFLLEEGLAERPTILTILSSYYQVPAMDVVGYFFDHELLLKFPKEVLLQNQIIPLEVDTNILMVIAARPDDQELLPLLGTYVSYDIQCMVGIGADIEEAIKEFYDESIETVPEDIDLKQEYREQEMAREQELYEDEEL